MSDFKVKVKGNSSLRLPTKCKYCPEDIVVEGEVKLQSKTVNPGPYQIIIPDPGYDGLSALIMNAIPPEYIIPEKGFTITENGEYDIAEYEWVEVKVPSGGGGGGDPDLPEGYRRVSYIKFNDAQMVDTGIVCNQDSKINIHFTRDASGSVYLYGVESSDNTKSITAYLGGNWRFGSKAGSISPTTNENLIYTSEQSKTGVVCTAGNRTYSGVTAFETVGTMIIGGSRKSSGSLGVASFNGKVLLFEIWQGSTLALKLIPVTDGTTYRFWDSVGNKFHDSITSTPLDGGNL